MAELVVLAARVQGEADGRGDGGCVVFSAMTLRVQLGWRNIGMDRGEDPRQDSDKNADQY